MKNTCRMAVVVAAAVLGVVCLPGRVAGQELSAEAKDKAAAEARAKRNALQFENNATTIVFYDRAGKRVGTPLGERALYGETVISPDRTRVAVVKNDLTNETADLFVLDIATGASTRLTTSARTEFVMAPVWSPDSKRIAYVTILKGQEGIYVRAADGKSAADLLYSNPGAFLDLSDWSADSRFLTFSFSDMKGGTLYTLPLEGADRKPAVIYQTDLRIGGAKFSPDGRFLSYAQVDKANKVDIFVRPVDPKAAGGPWQVSEGASSEAYWRRDGKELYYLARDRAVTMVAEVSTSPTFSVLPAKVLFRQDGKVPDRLAHVSSDGERFLALPPARGPQLQQITVFNRSGEVVQKVGEPGLYGGPAFSPDGTRLLVSKNDQQNGQTDLWTIELATGKNTRLTNDTFPKVNPLWSPDGKHIYYSSFRDGDFPVFRRPSDGTGSEELLFRYTPGAFVGLTDISSDGKSLVCDSGGVIMLVPLTGDVASRKEIEFIRDEFTDLTGRLSPDGRYIAYRSDEAQPERFEVYVRPVDTAKMQPGSGKWRVSKEGVAAMLHWRGDGKEIFFRGQNLESNEMLVMSAEVSTAPTFTTGTPKLLFKLPGPLGGNLGNVSRDGQRFVFAVNVPAGGTR